MNDYTPETLRAAFSDPKRYVLPPGSMTLEPEQTVAGKFADAWQQCEDQRHLQHMETLRLTGRLRELEGPALGQLWIENQQLRRALEAAPALQEDKEDIRDAWRALSSEYADLLKRVRELERRERLLRKAAHLFVRTVEFRGDEEESGDAGDFYAEAKALVRASLS